MMVHKIFFLSIHTADIAVLHNDFYNHAHTCSLFHGPISQRLYNVHPANELELANSHFFLISSPAAKIAVHAALLLGAHAT